jgi:23S rRNA (uracil1939-C5)-methyltransferase
VQLKIEKLVYGGDGLARLPPDEHGRGKSVFVPFTLRGEEVEAELVEQKPGFARARTERILEASPDRIEPGCPYFARCGGCHYQHASYASQLKAKSAILIETLKRTAKLDLPCELQVHASPEWNYRNRTRLKVQAAPEFALGYYRFRSHDLLPVEKCPISSPLINRAIAAMWESGRKGQVAESVREVEFFADHADGRLLAEIYVSPTTSPDDAKRAAEELRPTLPNSAGVVAFQQPMPNQMNEPRKLANSGVTELEYQAKFMAYRVSAGAFFQVNRFLIDKLAGIVTDGASGNLALDLYAGVGLFAAVLAKSFAQVIAVESSQTSHSDLRHNSQREVEAVLATSEQYLGQPPVACPDLVVVDPPRGGLGERVVRALARMGPQRITYVSCDPSTLARDLQMLAGSGYQIAGAHLIDLFPQTYHIESVFHLAR